MEDVKFKKGINYLDGRIFSFLCGGILISFASLYIEITPIIRIILILFGGWIMGRIYKSWYESIVRAQRNPDVAVFLFIFMFLVLAIGSAYIGF